MGRKTSLILCLAVIRFGFLNAQNSLSLSMDNAIGYALQYNKVVENAGLAIDEARAKVKETIAMGLPQLDATVDYSNFLGAEMELRFTEGAPPTRIPFKPTSNFNLSVGQLIFSGSYIVGIQTAKLYINITETTYRKSEQDIKEQVINAYYLALVAERSRDIIGKNLENIKDVYTKTKAMADMGLLEETDADQLSVQVTMLENAFRSAERQVELSYNILRLQLGVSVETEIKLTQTLDELLNKINFEAALLNSFKIENNLDYQLMKSQEKISEKQVELEKMQYLPTVSGFYSYSEKILKPELDFSPKNVVGIKVNIPIFSSGIRSAKLHQARLRLESTRNNRELLTDQLLIMEKQYRYNLNSALEQFASQKSNVEVSKRVYESNKLKYQQGIVSSLDLTTANNNYLKAETDYITALFKLLEAYVTLEKHLNNF